jgi:hypothetical protein
MMKRVRSRLTYANVMATIAVFIALGGTVYAAAKINGKQIKPNSIPANRLKAHSLTGTQINASTLGTVPSATSAGTASSAANASNANALGGSPAPLPSSRAPTS